MTEVATKTPLLQWKGVLANESNVLRRLMAVIIAMACITPVITQWGYVGIQFSDGTAAYLLFMFIPVVLGALLLGTVPGAATGLFAGGFLYVHSLIAPLDYYELTYVTPITSIVLTTGVGFLLGLLFAWVLGTGVKHRQRVLMLALACLAVSCAYSVVSILSYHALTQTPAVFDELSPLSVVFHILANALIMAITVIVGLACAEQGARGAQDAGLRAVFGAWLAGLVVIAFMVIGVASFCAVTLNEFSSSAADMQDETEFILDQVEYAVENTDASPTTDPKSTAINYEALASNETLRLLFAGYSEDTDGLMAVAIDDIVIGGDSERVVAGETLEELFDEDVLAAVKKSSEEDTLERVIYEGLCAGNDLYDLALPGTEEAFANLLTRQVGYLFAVEHDGCQIVLIRPNNMVYSSRDDVVGWVFISSLVLLLAVLALTAKLLDRLVANRIDNTNGVLERIAGGDLNARVQPDGSIEFVQLSNGINSTVDTLNGWIEEAESRMDAELATAKAIQESALPNVFPPYPDIKRFDIYATMNAAKEVGGDFYDFFLIGDDCGPDSGKLAFVLADVSGKGVPAALFMMQSKTLIHDYLASGMELGEAIENVNHQLCIGNEEGMFVTAWVGVLDYETWHVDFVNAGHNPPLLWQGGSWTWLKQKSGLPLGLFDEMPYRTHSIDCSVGDQFLIYTDGVTEAFSVDEEEYGEDRLWELVQDCFTLHPRELNERVRKSVAAFAEGAEQSDDITILALEIGVPSEEKAQLVVPANIEELANVNDFIHAELTRRLCSVRAQNQLDIAVEELFVNACKYAYADLDESIEHCIRVTYEYSANPASLTVEIIDDGVPFNPLATSDSDDDDDMIAIPQGGLGILMAKKNVNEMSYERVGDSNIVTLVKRW